MNSEAPRRVRVLVGLVVTAVFLCIVQTRTDGSDLFVGAERGAFWAEHIERLGAVTQSRGIGSSILEGDWERVRSWIAEVDRRFPPGLYLWGAAIGNLFTHDAEVIARSMSVWWLLLAVASGLIALRISQSAPWSFVAGYSATLAIPGLGSLSLTYFFDLPMAAMIWIALAAWILLEKRLLLAGVVAGFFLFCAGLFKWTALPIGGLMLACSAAAGLLVCWDRKRFLWTLAGLFVAAVTMLLGFSLWRQLDGSSFDNMLEITASAKISADVAALQVGPWTLAIVDWDPQRLAWYAVRGVTQVMGPLAVLPLGIAAVWGARGWAGWFCLLVVLTHALFYVVLIPPMDARFIMTAAPALGLIAAVGWLRTGRAGAVLAVVTLLACGLTLAEFHHGERNAWNRMWPSNPSPGQALTGRGVFLDLGDRLTAGWPKAESTSPFLPGREAFWDTLVACDRPALVVPVNPMGQMTDTVWLAYRYKLAEFQGEPVPGKLVETRAVWGEEDALPELPQGALLLLGAIDEDPPDAGPEWTLQGSYVVGQRNLSLWSFGEAGDCDLDQVFEQTAGGGEDEPKREQSDAPDVCQAGSPLGSVRAEGWAVRPSPPSSDSSCDGFGVRCAAPYLSAAKRLNPEPDNCEALFSELAVTRELDRSERGRESWREGESWTAGELLEAVEEQLDLGAQRGLVYWESPVERVNGGQRMEILVEDSLLGTQRVLLYLPDGPGPHPAVVGLLGHDQSADEFMLEHAGQEVLDSGLALAIPVVRAYDSGEAEDAAARAMLCAGSSMMASRVTEVRNTLQLLKTRPDVCGNRLALLAHSGGSLVANLLSWVQPELRGIVTDMEGRYNGAREDGASGRALLRDETHPGLRPLNLRIIDFRDAPVPTLRVRYGMPDGPAEVVEFLNEALRSSTRIDQPPPLPPPQ